MTLTDTDVELIRASWIIARRDSIGAGMLLFKGLFTKFPDYLRLFNQFLDLDMERMHENKRLIKHAVKVIDTLTFVVDSIGDPTKSEQLNEALVNLVRSHLKRTIGLKEFRNMGIVLLDFICELNNRRNYDGPKQVPMTDLSRPNRRLGHHTDNEGRGGFESSTSSSKDSETMTSALDKIRTSSSPSSSEDENPVARTTSGSVLIEDNDVVLSPQINNDRENQNRFIGATLPQTTIDDNGDELAARRGQVLKLDTSLLVAAWTKLYGIVLDLVKREESSRSDASQV